LEQNISASILGYVKRTREPLILNDANTNTDTGQFSWDEYLLQNQPKSILCIPIVRQVTLIGVLYLENNLATRAFTPAHQRVLEMLAAQAAISLEIAFLVEKELQARAEAEKALRIRNEFMLIAAHELRTPLTPVKIQLQLLKSLLAQDTASSDYKKKLIKLLESSDHQIERLSKLVDDLLDISRMSTGKLTLNFEEIDLSDLTGEIVERFRSEWARLGCVVEVFAEPRICGSWDRFRIEQVIINLLTNAMKYGAGKPIRVTVTREKDQAKLIVQDQGIGIAEKDQKRIFDRFERAVSVDHFGGFGLGLYISKQIVQAHGGVIEVESRPGQGSTFMVKLPLKLPSFA
jgi:signal transduction histidine kinase